MGNPILCTDFLLFNPSAAPVPSRRPGPSQVSSAHRHAGPCRALGMWSCPKHFHKIASQKQGVQTEDLVYLQMCITGWPTLLES